MKSCFNLALFGFTLDNASGLVRLFIFVFLGKVKPPSSSLMVGGVGVEPTKLLSNGFTDRPRSPALVPTYIGAALTGAALL